MKKIFTLLVLLSCLQFITAQAQQNIYMWKQGSLQVFNTSEVDSLTFNAGSLFSNLSCSAPMSVTGTSATATLSVTLGVETVYPFPEIGVCFSKDSKLPTIQDNTMMLNQFWWGDFTFTISGCAPGTQYFYRAYVTIGSETFYSDVQTFTTLDGNNQPDNSYVMVNGHKFVDLGLPSGLKWATCNVGADVPEADGDYFAWGETKSKDNYDTYTWVDGETYIKYSMNDKTTLEAEDDAATQNWGEGCRMPTMEEFQELVDNCIYSWTSLNGVSGCLFASKTNGANVFFPASGGRSSTFLNNYGLAGNYWSSSLGWASTETGAIEYCPYYLLVNSNNHYIWETLAYFGQTVRAVCP